MKIKPKSDDETQVQRRQNLDAAVKELKGPEVNTVNAVLKHSKAASTNFAHRKTWPVWCVSKMTVPVSRSTPACISSFHSQIQAIRVSVVNMLLRSLSH